MGEEGEDIIAQIPSKINIAKEIEIRDELKKLTKREREMIEMIDAGWTQERIAKEFRCSQPYISRKLKHIKEKFAKGVK